MAGGCGAGLKAISCQAGLARPTANGTPFRAAAIPRPVGAGARSVHAERAARTDNRAVILADGRRMNPPRGWGDMGTAVASWIDLAGTGWRQPMSHSEQVGGRSTP